MIVLAATAIISAVSVRFRDLAYRSARVAVIHFELDGLDLPGYDVTALVEKSGKSAIHIVKEAGVESATAGAVETTAHIDRELAARPQLVQLGTAWRNPKEQRPGALQKYQYREFDATDNPDAEPPCPHTKAAITIGW